MEYATVYGTLPIRKGDPVANAGDEVVQAVSDTALPELGCPDNPVHFADPDGKPGHKYALTNYKGLGATCMSSLTMALTPGTKTVAAGTPAPIRPNTRTGRSFRARR